LQNDGKVDADQDLHISRFRLKGLLTDYRKFHLQSESTSFAAICNIVGRRCLDPRVRNCLDRCREAWKKPSTPAIGWHNGFSVDEVMDAYFNDSVFHVASSRKKRLEEIQAKLTDRAILFAAYHSAWSRLLQIRNVVWIVRPAIQGQSAVRVPIDR
jgi:hypothetical protein